MTMYPREFTTRTVDLLQAAAHPQIATVHTAADAGLEVPACGVVVTLIDGWRLVVQCLRGSGPEGDPEPAGEQRAPVSDPLPATSGLAPEPAIGVQRLLDGIRGLWVDDPAVQLAELTSTTVYAADRPHLRLYLTDGVTLYVTVIAVVAPGRTLAGWALHQVPEQF